MHKVFKRENDYQASEVRRMQAEFERGALSRRHFLQGMLATGLTLTSATAILRPQSPMAPPETSLALRDTAISEGSAMVVESRSPRQKGKPSSNRPSRVCPGSNP